MSDFGFDPYIIQNYARSGNQNANDNARTQMQRQQSISEVAGQRQQQQIQQYQFQRQQQLADLVRGNAGAFSDPYAQSLAGGGFGQEAFEAQQKAFERGQQILGLHRSITASRLSAAKTPEQLDAVLENMPDDVRQLYGAPAKAAGADDKETWRQGFIKGQLTPEQQAENQIKTAGNRELKENPATGQMLVFDKNTGSVAPVTGAGSTPGLGANALDSAAKMYHQTGEMPDLGRDPSGLLHKQILARAEELFPGANVAANKAGYKADAASLEHLQPQADAVNGFIRTFDKNMKMLEQTASKLDSSNRPGINKGIRWYQTQMSGDPALTAFKQALSTVTSEAGKINSGSTGAGGVPISVMQEMEQNLPADATPKQIVEALKVLRADSENRRAAMREQLGEIKGRLSGDEKKPAPKTAKAAPNHDAAAAWLRSPESKSNPNYARALAAYKRAHGGAEP